MSYYGGGAYLYVDTSELQSRIDFLKSVMTKSQFEKLMHRTFNEVAKKSKTLISKEVVKDYVVTQKWVKEAIGGYNLSLGGGGVKCVIPLRGHKGTIGGRFRAHGLKSGISADIVRTGRSRLPKVMVNQGGNPPFINSKSSTLGGVAFTRRTAARLPIVRVVGLGVPQMPMNRSSDNVSESLLEYAQKRLEHNFSYMMSLGGR